MASILKIAGRQCRAIRKSRKWSIEALAEKANLHYRLIAEFERGQRNVTLENVEKIADGLNVSVRDLFPAEESLRDEKIQELLALLSTTDDLKHLNLIVDVARRIALG
jgi:transcriptional regulator with XRE-family HTH domain